MAILIRQAFLLLFPGLLNLDVKACESCVLHATDSSIMFFGAMSGGNCSSKSSKSFFKSSASRVRRSSRRPLSLKHLKTLKISSPAKRKQVASWAVHCDEIRLALMFTPGTSSDSSARWQQIIVKVITQ